VGSKNPNSFNAQFHREKQIKERQNEDERKKLSLEKDRSYKTKGQKGRKKDQIGL